MTLAILRPHCEIVDGIVASHQVRIVNGVSGSVIAEFARSVDAVMGDGILEGICPVRTPLKLIRPR